MSIILKHILRNIRKNYFSGLLIVISLVLSTAVIYLNLNINRDMLSISQQMFSGFFGGYDICVSADDGGKLRADDSAFADGDALAVCYDSGVCPDLEQAAAVCFMTDWELAAQRGIVTATEGTAPHGTTRVGITAKKAAYYNLRVGDRITVSYADGDREYEISTIYDSIGMFVRESRDCIELLCQPDSAVEADNIYLDIKGDVFEIHDEMQEAHPAWNIQVLNGAWDADNQVKSIRQILYMMLALAMIMSYYVINSVTNLMLAGRLPVIGTFRSIGASNGKMNLLLLAENAIYGLVGGAVGILVGELLRYLLAVLYYNAKGAQHMLDWRYVFSSIGFAVLLQTGVTLITVLRAGNHSIRESIFRTTAAAAEIPTHTGLVGAVFLLSGAVLHLTNHTYNFYHNLVALALVIVGSALLLPFLLKYISRLFAKAAMRLKHGPLYLAFRNLAASRINISSVTLTTMVIALAMVVLLCTSSVSSYFEAYRNNYPYDIFVKGLTLTGEEYDFLTDLETVDHTITEYWDYGDTELNGTATHVCFVECGGYSNGITLPEGAEENLPDGHAILDELFASRHGIHIGDRVQFTEPYTGRCFYEVIDNFCDSGVFNSARSSVLLTQHDYKIHVEQSPALIGIYLNDYEDLDDVLSELPTTIFGRTGENVSVYSKEASIAKELENTQDALSIFSVVPVLAAVLAVLGLVNNQIIAYNRKRREYAVLYSVAMSRQQLGHMVFEELALVFLTGTVFGTLLSLWLMCIVRDIIFGLIAYVAIRFDILKILVVLLGAFAILCISALIPRTMVTKMNVIEEIKYD